ETDLNFDGSGFAPPFKRGTAVASFSENKSGWSTGAGIETQLAGKWTGKIEYLYMDLGTVSGSVIPIGGSPGTVNRVEFSSNVHDHVIRVGVNYKFDDWAVVSRY